jgi:hypothetical protein
MQVEGRLNGQASSILNLADAGMQSIPNKTPRTRKVTVQLSEKVFERLEAAIDRPGVGKSMVVEDALERFLSPTPPIEDLLREQFDQIHAKLGRFDKDMRLIAETVALHARYHLTVMPPLRESQQREACLHGDERFKVLAEQVDRRVRLGRPLMQETTKRLNAANLDLSEPEIGEGGPSGRGSERMNEETASETDEDIQDELSAAAPERGSNSNFRHFPNSLCSPA